MTATRDMPFEFKRKEFNLQLRGRQAGTSLQLILCNGIVADCVPGG
jgi:hypothetical protein